jgi:hypothetical protein
MQEEYIRPLSLNDFSSVAHHMAVKKLAFQPLVDTGGGCDMNTLKNLQISSCGVDHAVKIFNIYLNKL